MNDRDFELACLRRDREMIARQLASAQDARESEYVEKFGGQLGRTDARIAELEATTATGGASDE